MAAQIAGVNLGKRTHPVRMRLIHPVHQQVIVAAWEVHGTAG